MCCSSTSKQHIPLVLSTQLLTFFQVRTEIHREDSSQNPGGYKNNTHRVDNIFLRCCRWRIILLHASRWWQWNRRTDPSTKRAISGKGNRMGSRSGTILNEAKYQRFDKDRRKQKVVFHQGKERKCTRTSRVRCWSSIDASKTQNNWPTTWWCASDSGQTISALRSKWGSQYPQR